MYGVDKAAAAVGLCRQSLGDEVPDIYRIEDYVYLLSNSRCMPLTVRQNSDT